MKRKKEAKKIQEKLGEEYRENIMCIAMYNCKSIECKCAEGECIEE